MGKKKKKCYSGIGGQAVMEGIMMRNKDRYSVAVRKPDHNIEIQVSDCKANDSIWTKIPFVRGVFNFVDSMVIGMKTLSYSAEFFAEGTEEEETAFDRFLIKIFGKKAEKVIVGMTVAFGILLAIGLFMVLPWALSFLLERYISNASLIAILEGVFRIVIFLLYVLGISLMKDIRRVFMYHGAEHKCINCLENGMSLNVKNVMKSSRLHKRCGTSFLLIVMVISIILFFFIRVDHPLLRLGLRVALVPVIAGISYEILRLAGKFDNWFINIISAPGIALQLLTTREPEEEMAEVAIKAVEAVFDWKAYLKENFSYDSAEEGWLDEDDEDEEEDSNIAMSLEKEAMKATVIEPAKEAVASEVAKENAEEAVAESDVVKENAEEAVAESDVVKENTEEAVAEEVSREETETGEMEAAEVEVKEAEAEGNKAEESEAEEGKPVEPKYPHFDKTLILRPVLDELDWEDEIKPTSESRGEEESTKVSEEASIEELNRILDDFTGNH